jgi:hypothetical protein
MTEDPLAQIFSRTEQVEGEQRAVLAKLILPYASINPETGNVYFTPTTEELNAKQKIYIYLLCRLALSSLTNSPFSATVSPKEIEISTHIPGGTVRPALLHLLDEKDVLKSGEGYYVPSAILNRAKNVLPSK